MRWLLAALRAAFFVGFALALIVLTPACKHWPPDPNSTAGKIVDCAERSIRNKGLAIVGQVNDILGNRDLTDPDAESSLIALGVKVGEDVLGCVLQEQGIRFADSARRNSADTTSAMAATRANRRLAELAGDGWQFKNAGGG